MGVVGAKKHSVSFPQPPMERENPIFGPLVAPLIHTWYHRRTRSENHCIYHKSFELRAAVRACVRPCAPAPAPPHPVLVHLCFLDCLISKRVLS